MDRRLSTAIVAYTRDEGSAFPGRHPERVPDPDLRARVEAVIRRLDAIRPDETARDLLTWADRQATAVVAESGDLAPEAVRALRDLLSWEWR
ncbi:hypothetical protein [Leifsonia aquatica]|uniref:hypothetical protein n=1 Tax=Leifsonia aquatica TaxID=144185 RepID=UPI0028A79A23|nr:hypothetical protein [Leifsonia aquatica]